MPSKRYKKALGMIEAGKSYPLEVAAGLLAKLPRAKFNESVELAFRLGVDPKQSDQMVRGTVALPHGSGKVVRVLVFAKPGPAAEAARQAGAEHVGFDDMIKKCSDGWTDFDIAVATPDAMSEVRKLGKVLGPRGPDAQSEDGDSDGRHRAGGERVQSGAGRVQDRQDRQPACADWQGLVHGTAFDREWTGGGGSGAEGEAEQRAGHVCAELHHVGDDESAGTS
jgi:large subunit ribosomal protein L1